MATPPIDRLSSLLERFSVRAHLFHTGPLCGVTTYAAKPGRGFLHVLRQGEMVVTHRASTGLQKRIKVSEPSLLFYPRPMAHQFHNTPDDGADFACATLDFEGGPTHPLVLALPPLVLLPLSRVEGLAPALALLFAETERVQCGQRLLADRLFEVVLLQMLRWLLDHPEDGGVPVGMLTGLADPRLARALVAVHDHPGQPWSLESLAQEAGMSRTSFAARFKSMVGTTPGDYLANWRMTLTQTGLRQGKPVKLLASDLGYANASALSRVFGQRMGMSPRQWLMQSRAEFCV
ncbi:AraC family transcriptional regulator [Aquabacterium sp.]|uniref:AraC family transcriptional regulator n=1 Tax=Aquabacterium sp. TaxID=1872578 RepID=UPI002486DB5B|nr:AraC family transcriptional regulator [Aquabacterium sp.]MDI1260001.1 AraC family transcriptional regulator [Aquabacterium sp.]